MRPLAAANTQSGLSLALNSTTCPWTRSTLATHKTHTLYASCKSSPSSRLTASFVEEQGKAFCRRYPKMRIASIRPHWVIPESLAYNPEKLHELGGTWKDLWGWVSIGAISRAFILALTAPESTFPLGHEAFFTVAPTMCRQASSADLIKETFPEIKDLRREWKGNEGFYDCSKAERMLGWSERAFLWTPENKKQ